MFNPFAAAALLQQPALPGFATPASQIQLGVAAGLLPAPQPVVSPFLLYHQVCYTALLGFWGAPAVSRLISELLC